MQTSHSDALAQTERALLGSVLFSKSVWPLTDGLSAEDFSLDSHRRIFARIAAMFEDLRSVDLVTLTMELGSLNQLESCGGPEYVASLIDNALPENFSDYVRAVRTAAFERRIKCQVRLLNATCSSESTERLSALRKQTLKLNELLDAGALQRENWRSLFHSYEEFVSVPPVSFAIEGFLQEEGITLIGGLAGHGKTLCMLAMARALLEGGKLFHHFRVNKPAERVIYLIPEAGLGPFVSRLKTFHLEDYVRDERLLFSTLSAKCSFSLTDPRLLEAAKGADVFLDTAVRFMEGDENSASEPGLRNGSGACLVMESSCVPNVRCCSRLSMIISTRCARRKWHPSKLGRSTGRLLTPQLKTPTGNSRGYLSSRPFQGKATSSRYSLRCSHIEEFSSLNHEK
jgi:hypothetical protein